MTDPNDDDDDDDLSDEEDFESIPCSWKYVSVCILLPCLNGSLNGFVWPGYSLHYDAMGWPLVRAGLAVTVGFLVRMTTQQMQLRAGYWLIVPLASIHLTFAALALIYTTSEWAVFSEIVVAMGIDSSAAIEGVAFDSFGASEVQARQATSTVLSVFTIAIALSCTVGGFIYDFWGWTGVAGYHTLFQSLLLIMLITQPAIRASFRETFFPASTAEEASKATEESPVSEKFDQVVPTGSVDTAVGVPGMVEEELKVEEQEEIKEVDDLKPAAEASPRSRSEATGEQRQNLADGMASAPVNLTYGRARLSNIARLSRSSRSSRSSHTDRSSRRSHGGRLTQHATRSTVMSQVGGLGDSGAVAGEHRGTIIADQHRGTIMSFAGEHRGTVMVPANQRGTVISAVGDQRNTVVGENRGTVMTLGLPDRRSTRLGGTRASQASRFSMASQRSLFSSFSSFSSVPGLAEAGQDFRHHFGTSGALQPKIVGATGAKATLRDDVEVWDDTGKVMEQEKSKKASIPKDIRLPAFLILLTGFCNNASYTLEFATFAIYFKQVHNWNEAIWASLAQTSGDVMAAIAMQLLPRIFSGEYDWDEASSCMRFFHNILSQPYALSFALFTWVVFEFGMMSPVLALAIVAQVFMGSSYVYTSKFATDMNLVYVLFPG